MFYHETYINALNFTLFTDNESKKNHITSWTMGMYARSIRLLFLTFNLVIFLDLSSSCSFISNLMKNFFQTYQNFVDKDWEINFSTKNRWRGRRKWWSTSYGKGRDWSILLGKNPSHAYLWYNSIPSYPS